MYSFSRLAFALLCHRSLLKASTFKDFAATELLLLKENSHPAGRLTGKMAQLVLNEWHKIFKGPAPVQI